MTKQLKSNIYKNLTVLFVLAFVILLARVIHLAHSDSAIVYAVQRDVPMPTPTYTEIEPESETGAIKELIEDVFQEDAHLAFQLLQSPQCAENRTLNPNAINYNNDQAQSRDCGVFQINEYWQKTQCKFLLNPEVNVEIAHQLYSENGKSFKLWTCGKVLGI